MEMFNSWKCIEWKGISGFHIELVILSFEQKLSSHKSALCSARLPSKHPTISICKPKDRKSLLLSDKIFIAGHGPTNTHHSLQALRGQPAFIIMKSLNGNITSRQNIQSTKSIMCFSEYDIRIENIKISHRETKKSKKNLINS